MTCNRLGTFVILLMLLGSIACQEVEQDNSYPLFSLVDQEQSGFNFVNELSFARDFNVYKYRNYYNGGGVSIGDVNNDGLLDIYMTANMTSNQLFLNKGNFEFENVTASAGVAGTKGWSTGSTMIDIDADGLLDIYVCNSGDIKGDNKENELFINNGDGSFSERAEAFGLNDKGLSTHASFFDYDKDGDLDVYLLNNSFKAIGSFNLKLNQRDKRDELGGDKLLRNDEGIFVDVSEQAGIYGSVIGFGLGITVGDVNNDAWEDIFVSNDFFERDYLYINQKDGTFNESLTSAIKSISGASMGADIGDINNDGQQDIFVTEMLPDDPQRLKSVTTFEDWNKYQANLKNGYHHQFTRNTLHLNNGNNSFSEIGRYAGVEASDWSWGALFFDMDNDGNKDLFIANGIYQDLTDQDYLNYIANESVMSSIIKDEGVNYEKLIEIIPSNPLANHYYLNTGDVSFERAHLPELDIPTFSNGAAYGDLDNDGDLDLVINNVNMPSMIYKNLAEKNANNYLKINLIGNQENISAVGAKVVVTIGDTISITQEVQGARGFQSSSDTRLNFGLGAAEKVDVKVIWQEDQIQELIDVNVNQTLEIEKSPESKKIKSKVNHIVKQVSELNILHQENNYSDFNRERLLYLMKSNEGPRIKLADLDHNQYQDLVITGAKGDYSKIYFDFETDNEVLLELDYNIELKEAEHIDVEIGDFNGDGWNDLYLASGGNDISPFSPVLFDHLLINQGNRKFEISQQKLPNGKDNISTSVVVSDDIDGDGDLDLYLGERMKIGAYGAEGSGYLLVNDGKGNFEDKTSEFIPDAINIGMTTDAIFTDINGDEHKDLVVVGEFMSVHCFINTGDGFEHKKLQIGEKLHGWWNTIHVADLDNDSDIDLIIGNHGLNSRFKASEQENISLYFSDFDQNGSEEGVLCYAKDGKDYPFHLRHNLLAQMRKIESRIPDYHSYKNLAIDDIFTAVELEAAKKLRANEMRTIILENKGGSEFDIIPLPTKAQLSPVYAITTFDYDKDGDQDIFLGGNQYKAQPEIGIYDASQGLIIENLGDMKFEVKDANHSGLRIEGQIRDLVIKQRSLFVARNDDKMLKLEFD